LILKWDIECLTKRLQNRSINVAEHRESLEEQITNDFLRGKGHLAIAASIVWTNCSKILAKLSKTVSEAYHFHTYSYAKSHYLHVQYTSKNQCNEFYAWDGLLVNHARNGMLCFMAIFRVYGIKLLMIIRGFNGIKLNHWNLIVVNKIKPTRILNVNPFTAF